MLLFAPVSFKDFSISGYAKRYLTAPTNFLSAVAVLVDRDKYKEYNYDERTKMIKSFWRLSLGVYRTEKCNDPQGFVRRSAALCRDHRDAENIGGTAHVSGGHCKGFIL